MSRDITQCGRNGFFERFLQRFFSPQQPRRPPPHLPIEMPPSKFSEPTRQWVTPRRYSYPTPWKWERVWDGPRVRSSPPSPCTRVKSVCDMSGSGEFNLYLFRSVTRSRAAPVSGYHIVREASPFHQFQQSNATPPPSINTCHGDPYEVQTPCAPGSILAPVGSRFV